MKSPAVYDFFLTPSYKWSISLGLGIFLYGFLILFLPFGVSNYDPAHEYTFIFLLEMAYFLATTVLLAALNEFMLKPLVVRRAGRAQVIIWSVWMALSLGLGLFLLYNFLGNWHDFSLYSAVEFVFNCSTMLAFPMVGIFFYYRFKSLNIRYQKLQVQGYPEGVKNTMLYFDGQGRNEGLAVSTADFRYARAQDNYVALYFLRDGKLQRELLRTTLAELAGGTDKSMLLRCHRSYVVNLHQIHSFTRGHPLLLRLRDLPEPIRVSKSYREVVLSRLKDVAATP